VSTDHVEAPHERLADDPAGTPRDIVWLSTQDAARRLGVTPRTLYRFIDEGQVPAYRFGRVIRLQLDEVDEFIERCRIQPGSLEHLYPESVGASSGGTHDE
jgi:excisionase family DNA binding protein